MTQFVALRARIHSYLRDAGRKAKDTKQWIRHNWSGFLMPPHLLTNFEIQKYYQKAPKLHSVYSRNNLPKIKDGGYLIILVSINQ